MRTRSQGLPLEPFDAEIEASNRRRNRQRRINIDREEPARNQVEPMEDNNAHPPPPPNYEQIILQLQQQMELMKQEREDERRRDEPIRNIFGNVAIPAPPVGTRVNANTFELKTGLIQMVKQHSFVGRPTEDPNKHLTKFVEISNTTKLNGVPDETIKLRLFPFSHTSYAKDWYDSLASGSVASWDELANQFLEIFFPLSSTLNLQAEISHFHMKDQESMFEEWERFNALLKKCPNYGISPGHQVNIFYNGCSDFIKSQLDFGCGRSFLDLGIEACKRILERLHHTHIPERENSLEIEEFKKDFPNHSTECRWSFQS